MDYMNETAKKIPAGDSAIQGLASKKKGPSAKTFEPSDIPGFVNPVVGGEPDLTAYIPEEAINAEQPPILSKDEAMAQAKKRKPAEEVLYTNEGV